MRGIADMAIARWFTPDFSRGHEDVAEHFRSMVEACPQAGYLGCCAALRDEDLREAISRITCPVLLIAGSVDAATPPEGLHFVRDVIPGARLLTLDAAHLSNVERSEQFTSAVMGFLGSL